MRNVRTMWFCCMLVFSAAIMLILISVMSETQVAPNVRPAEKEESAFNQTLQQSLSKMSDAIERLEEENINNRHILDELTEKLRSEKAVNKNYENLINVLVLLEEKKIDEAKELAANIDYEKLNDDGKKIYDGIRSIIL